MKVTCSHTKRTDLGLTLNLDIFKMAKITITFDLNEKILVSKTEHTQLLDYYCQLKKYRSMFKLLLDNENESMKKIATEFYNKNKIAPFEPIEKIQREIMGGIKKDGK